MPTDLEWSSVYPAALDTLTEMPNQTNATHNTRVSHVHSLREAVRALQTKVGSNLLEAGSILKQLAGLPSGQIAASQTTDTLHVYVNFTSGSDSNNGLSSGAAKGTWGGVFGLVPDIVKHNVVVHVVGTASEFGTVVFHRTIYNGKTVLIDGGANWTEVATYTSADVSSVSSIGKSTAGWTAGAHEGYAVEILTGTCAGQIRTIHRNTTTTITPSKDFTASPGACNFRIIKPATTLTSSTANSILLLSNSGGGVIMIQRMLIAGSKCQVVFDRAANARAAHVVSDMSGSTLNAIKAQCCNSVLLTSTRLDDTTLAAISTDTEHVGCSDRGTAAFSYVLGCNFVEVYGGFFYKLICEGSYVYRISEGTRFRGAQILRCKTADSAIYSDSGYAKVAFANSTGAGLILDGSDVYMNANVDISSNADHGIKIQNSFLQMRASVAGTANTGYGVLVEQRSIVALIAVTPTITGTSGDVAIYNGVSVSSQTWGLIATGTPLNNTDCHSGIRNR